MTPEPHVAAYMTSVMATLLIASPGTAILLFKARLGLDNALIIAAMFFVLGLLCWLFGYGAVQALEKNPTAKATLAVWIFALLIFLLMHLAIDKILGAYEGKPLLEAAQNDHDVDDHF